MTKFVFACLGAALIATPVFAAAEKKAAKADLETCRKLAREKHFIDAGRSLNIAVRAAVQRCMKDGPSAI